ncbi:MAG: PQQ-like beta-propeller repeat protein, partial [Planctomycetes bacterium]|nr:PQQ-like beta-propeller repeat protein [Planctomycetota bacterium]
VVAIELATGKVLSGNAGGAVKALSADARRALQEQLRSERFDRPAVSHMEGRTAADLPVRWQFNAGGKVQHLRTVQGNPGAHLLPGEGAALPDGFGLVAVPSAAGHVTFLDAAGAAVRRLDAGAPVNDVAVDDVDGDGRWEILVARDDCRLQCLDAATGEVRFDFAPKREPPANSTLQLGRNQAVYVFVAQLGPGAGKTLCVATGDQRLHGVNAKGERLWTFWSYAGIFGIHGLVDIAGGKAIVGGNPVLSSTDVVYFLKGGDTFARRVHLDGWGSTLSSLAIADMNGDGKSEILVGTGRGSLYALAADSESPLWNAKLGDDVRGVGIVHGDRGVRFVAAGSMTGFVTAFDGQGKKLWATAVGAPVRFLSIGPGQPREAIVAALADGTVALLDANGALTHAAKLPAAPSAFALARPKDGPGLVLVAGEDNVVRALALPVAR